jgi:hypothetical protein
MGIALSSFNIATLKLVSPSRGMDTSKRKDNSRNSKICFKLNLGHVYGIYILCICLSLSREYKFMKYNLWLSGIRNGVQLSF